MREWKITAIAITVIVSLLIGGTVTVVEQKELADRVTTRDSIQRIEDINWIILGVYTTNKDTSEFLKIIFEQNEIKKEILINNLR
jgi:hypothetical protein